MTIGIIGAGNMGKTLATLLKEAGHKVSIANSRGSASLKEFAAEHVLKAASVFEAATENDIVVIAIPQFQIPALPKDLFKAVSDEVIVIDAGNYFPLLRDGTIEELEGNLSNSAWVSKIIQRPVIKVFNSITAKSLSEIGRKKGDPRRIALSISGNNLKQKKIVGNLLDQIGFDYYDNGSLENSWKQEPGAPGYCMDYTLSQLTKVLNELPAKRTPQIIAQIKEQRTIREKRILGK